MGTIEVVLSDLVAGAFRMPRHAILRSDQRSISRRDIMACARDPISSVRRKDGRYEVVGLDESDEEIKVVAIYNNGTLIVTVIG